MDTPIKRLNRSEVPNHMTWNLDDLFKSHDDWLGALSDLEATLANLSKYQGILCQNGETLYEAMSHFEKLYEKLIQLGTYVNLKQAEDGTNNENQSLSMAFAAFASKVETQLSFLKSEVTALDEDSFYMLFKKTNTLDVFKNYLQDIYDQKKYQLTPETEKAMAALGEVLNAPYRSYSVSKAADMQFDSFEDQNGNVLTNSFALFESKYEFSDDPVLRRNAYHSFSKTLKQYKNTYGALYATEVKKQVAISQLKGYPSVTHMLLEPHKIDIDMYHNQLDIIYNQLAPHMQKLARLKKKVLNLDEMHFYDLKAPLDPAFSPPATYEEVQKVIKDALAILGDEYLEIIESAFANRWIDYADNVGKSTGAFCASPYGVHPFILITYQDNMRSAFTLAHELGHAGHFQLAMNTQRVLDLRPSTYFVEAPSTINEILLANHLMKADEHPRMKRWVILQLLGTYYHNFVTHLLEAEFQRRVYDLAEKGKPLTANLLCELKKNVIHTFWGDAIVPDEDMGLTWMRQPHYYMGLYPYTYSAGLSAATAIAKQMDTEGAPAVERWLNTLKLGGSKKPADLLKLAGIDMTRPQPIKTAVDYVGQLIQELEALFDV